jgi:hypothetical protein
MEDHSRPHELSFSWDRRGYSSRPFSARTAISWTSIADASLPPPSRRAELPRFPTGAVRARRREHHALPRVLTRAAPPRRRAAGRPERRGASAAAALIPAAFRRRRAAPHYHGPGAGVVIRTAILADGLASGDIWRRSSMNPKHRTQIISTTPAPCSPGWCTTYYESAP